ncbi:MAG: endonuclease/exonuclease/phosphatase family protein [Proteobacteria bacterium]|nr:endonuclease/exonuclease/phosphatase family protein [Pseudomonadota bacterium]
MMKRTIKILAFGFGILLSGMSFNQAQAEPPKTSPAIVFTPPAEYMVTELGDAQKFSVSLAAPPESKVILSLTSNDVTEGKIDIQEITFLRENWNVPQVVTVTGVDDNVPDGDRSFQVEIAVKYTKDAKYKSVPSQKLTFECLDDEAPDTKPASINELVANMAANGTPASKKVKLRIMTANTTTGEDQSYDNGEGIRIFKAMKPDIVLIQEFNYFKNSIKSFVTSTFGKEYTFVRGTGGIPNGIISKYPILEHGSWKSNKVSDRQWNWAVIDIPGKRDLLAVSVHLYTQDSEAEMEPLQKQIEKKIAADKKDYYVILGGDFNQPDWEPIRRHFGQMFEVGQKYADWPADQDGMVKTNATRHKQIDYLLCNPDFCALETPTVVGKRSYPKGHVVDSRVYKKHGELADIAPMKADDSEAHKMQHMAVIRDFEYVPVE